MTDTERAVIAAARDGLVYVPLGGAGEIGMNCYLYGCNGKWIAVECGVTFGDDSTPGIDIITADPGFLETIRNDLLGLVLTHAHEDHQGAVAHLWPRLRCPVYATAFTAGLVKARLAENGLLNEVPLRTLDLKGEVSLGPFRIRLVTVTHSIPEPNALAIETSHGRIVHTGDWKLDPDPLVGTVADETAFRALGDAGVLAMVCDSTNVFVTGESGSEGRVRDDLAAEITKHTGRVAVACFASNVARIGSIVRAAALCGRHVALVGRSLWRITEIARACGYLDDVPPFLTEHDAAYLPPEKALFICTGSQGERGSALERISQGTHPNVVLEAGDAVLFSSRTIPGNERAVYAMQNRLAALGVNLVTGRDAPIHVSGHPGRDELARLYRWVRPAMAIPMHGEQRHLIEHAAYARSLGIGESHVVTNGSALRLAPGPAKIVGEVPVGRLGLDGTRLIPLANSLMADRRRNAYAGAAFATIVVDRRGRLAANPQISFNGVTAEEDEARDLAANVAREVETLLQRSNGRALRNGDMAEEVRRTVRRVVRHATGKRPVTQVHVIGL